MKKAFLTIALVAFAMAANAQLILGGQFGVNNQTRNDGNYSVSSASSFSFNINPKVGYQLNEKIQLGAQVIYGYSTTKSYFGKDNTFNVTPVSQFGFSPYVRWNFGSWKNCSLFLEGSFVFGISPETKTTNSVNGTEVTVNNKDKFTYMGIHIVPGLNYSFSEHFSMDLYINIARLAWNHISHQDDWVENSFGVSANLNANDINSQLSTFAIGFNYHL